MTSPNPTPDPTPEPTPDPTPAPAAAVVLPDFQSWRGSLDPELRDQPSLEGIESFDHLVREHANVQRFIGGDKIAKPGADASEEDWNRFYGAMGRPDAPDKYDLSGFQAPESVPWDKGFQDQMVGVLHKHGVSQREIVGVLNDYAAHASELHQNNVTAAATAQREADAALRAEWGGAYEANTAVASLAFKEVMGEDLDLLANAVLPDGTPIGDSPALMRRFHKLGRMMRDAEMIGDPNAATAPTMSPAEARQRIDAIEQEPGFTDILMDQNKDKHPKRVEWNRLHDFLE